MGNDVYLQASTGDRGDATYIGCERSNRVSLFWLCCFRLEDLTLPVHGDGQEPFAPCCGLEVAIRQFKEGIKILRKTFPKTEKTWPSLGLREKSFVEKLERCGAGYLWLDTRECHDAPFFDFLLRIALNGFLNPGVTRFPGDGGPGRPDPGFTAVGGSGMINWAGAIRLLCVDRCPDFTESREDWSGNLLPAHMVERIGSVTNGLSCGPDDDLFQGDEPVFPN